MTIEKITPGRGKPERYFIRNEAGTTLAWFDSLDVAACVLRYLKGAPMPAAGAVGELERRRFIKTLEAHARHT